jgi:hypothetical protein
MPLRLARLDSCRSGDRADRDGRRSERDPAQTDQGQAGAGMVHCVLTVDSIRPARGVDQERTPGRGGKGMEISIMIRDLHAETQGFAFSRGTFKNENAPRFYSRGVSIVLTVRGVKQHDKIGANPNSYLSC